MAITDRAPSTERLMTAEEAAQLSTVNRRFELVKGVYAEMSPSSARHGDVALTLALLLGNHVKQNKLGKVTAAETGFLLACKPDTVRAADVGFISVERLPAGGVPATGYWPFAPDLAVEVVSPHDDPDEVQQKVEDYLAAGTRMVWVVYPKPRSITVYRSLTDIKVRRGADPLTGEDVLPGFECQVSEVFE